MSAVKVYDQNQKLLAVLDAANDVGYELKHNDLSTGSFQLPTLDPRNEYCAAHNYVQIEDGERDLGLFRIIGMPQGDTDDWTGYELEHVMATLVDDVLFGQHEVGGTGVFTADVIAYILARQTVFRWQLGVCDFADQFAYNFENCTLLAALYSISNLLVSEFTWDFDTSTTPWTVNLRRADLAPGCGIHYMRNLKQIEKTMDATALVTRLYCLGYGEGVNQLGIKSVNGGLPYLDADTVGTWGVKCSVFVDTTIQDAATLKQRAQAVLEGYKNPYITYTATAADLYALTGHSWDNYMPGKLVQVMDGEHGITFQARIISIRKADVNGKPQDIEITIANAQKDTADSINQLADRVGISELYSQGATSLYVFQYAENCTPAHPATFSIPIPESAVRINVVKFLLKREAYRADAQGAASGGGSISTTSSGGGGTTTSAAGGAATLTDPQRIVSTEAVTGGPISGHSGDTSGNTGGALTMDMSGTSMTATGSAGGGIGGTPVDAGGAAVTVTATNDSYSTGSAGSGIGGTPVDAGGAAVTVTATNDSYNTGSAGGGSTGSAGSGIGGTPVDSGGAAVTVTATNSSYDTGSAGSGSTGDATASHYHTIGSHQHQQTSGSYTEATRPSCSASDNTLHSHSIGGHTHTIGGHSHSFSHRHAGDAHTHSIDSHTHTIGGHSHSFSHRHAGEAHTHTIGGHSHSFSHRHAGAEHSHNMAHYHNFSHNHNVSVALTIPEMTLTVPTHTHSVSLGAHSHSLTLNDHTHALIYDIYEGPTASSFTMTVDGVAVNGAITDAEAEVDITALLSKDANGKIERGTWHTVVLTPNQATRAVVNVYAQVFVQSKGGGDY